MPNQRVAELASKLNNITSIFFDYFNSIDIIDENDMDDYLRKHAEEILQATYPELFELTNEEFGYLLISNLLNEDILDSFINIIIIIPQLINKINRDIYIPLINKTREKFFIDLLTNEELEQLSLTQLIKLFNYNKEHPEYIVNLIANEIKTNGIDELTAVIKENTTQRLPEPLRHLIITKTLLKDIPISDKLIELLIEFINKNAIFDVECLDIIQNKYPMLNKHVIEHLTANKTVFNYYLEKAQTRDELNNILQNVGKNSIGLYDDNQDTFTIEELKAAEKKGWIPDFTDYESYSCYLLKDSEIIDYYFNKINFTAEFLILLEAIGRNISYINKVKIKDSTVDIIIKYLDDSMIPSYIPSWYTSTSLKDNEKLLCHLLSKGHSKFIRFTKDSLFKKYINSALKANTNNDFWQDIFDTIRHNENLQDCYNSEFYQITKNYFVTKYNLNPKHLDKITEHFGYGILQVIENSNIINAINLDDSSFEKYVTMLKEDKLTIDDVNNIYEVFLNLQFKRKYSEVFDLFPQIKFAILNNHNISSVNIPLLYQNHNLSKLITIKKDGEAYVHKYTYICYLRAFLITLNNSNQKEEFYEMLTTIAENTEALAIIEDLKKINKANSIINYPLCERFYNLFPQVQNPENFTYINNNHLINYESFIAEMQKNPEQFYNELYETIKAADDVDKEKMLNVFNIITNENINAQRALFISKQLKNKENTLNFNYEYDEKRKASCLAELYLQNYLKDFWKQYNKNGFDLELIATHPHFKIFTNQEYLEECIKFIIASDKKNYIFSDKYPKATITPKVKAVKEMIALLLEDKKLQYTYNDLLKYEEIKDARKIDLSRQNSFIYEIMQSINIDSFKANILNNQSIFDELCAQLKKYKFLDWGNIFTQMSINIGYEYSSYSVATLINFYHKIHENLEQNNSENKSQLMNILTNTSIFSSVSNIYNLLLGNENLRLIKLNPGPNSSSDSVNNRINSVLDSFKHLYLKQNNTVPSINKEINTSENQKIRIVLGDLTNPINLTYGERTGSCMRIKGAGDTFFDFCLQNENGFHIRFENPTNGQFISRVSGFRNGNTIFLNELRHSVDKNYSDQQIIEACEQAAQEIISQTANSSCPIQNVVIHKAYAMNSSTLPEISFNIDNAKEGLPHFYSDINTLGIVLASTNDKKLVPINFDKTKVELYESLREPTIESDIIEEFLPNINRINIIENLINSNNPQDTPIISESAFLKSWYGQDWYIVIDSNFNIITKNLNLDNRAEKEFQTAREAAEIYITNKQQGKESQHVQYIA